MVNSVDSNASRAHVVTRHSGLKSLASVGRKDQSSIARQVMKDSEIKDKVLKILAKDVNKEMKVLLSKKYGSILRTTDPAVLQSFTWDAVVADIQACAPTLVKVLKGLVQTKRRVRSKLKVAVSGHRLSSDTAIIRVFTSTQKSPHELAAESDINYSQHRTHFCTGTI